MSDNFEQKVPLIIMYPIYYKPHKDCNKKIEQIKKMDKNEVMKIFNQLDSLSKDKDLYKTNAQLKAFYVNWTQDIIEKLNDN